MKNFATLLLIIITSAQAQNTTNNDAVCIAESAALVTSAAISGPYDALRTAIETDVKDDFMQFCNVLRRTCTVNVADYSAALQTACTGEGGQIVLKEAYLDCTGKLMNIPVPGGIDIEIFNIPGCVSANCDAENLPEAIVAVFEAGVEQVATEVETAVQESDIECGTITQSQGSGSGGVALGSTSLLVSVATLFVSFVLL
jgi:hypothetical protein